MISREVQIIIDLELTTAKERAEKKSQKNEEEFKRVSGLLDKESRAKWQAEQDKMSKERELKDTQKLVFRNLN